MSEDSKNLRISLEGNNVSEKIEKMNFFPDRIAICKFAFAYALKNYQEELNDLESLDNKYDSNGTNYNIGSIDADKTLSQLITTLYPGCQTPYKYVRTIICFGFEKLGELLDKKQTIHLSELM